jgi:hypothetical protein
MKPVATPEDISDQTSTLHDTSQDYQPIKSSGWDHQGLGVISVGTLGTSTPSKSGVR